MHLENLIQATTQQALYTLYQFKINVSEIVIGDTKKEFEGDITVVIFPFVKALKKAPQQLGSEIGEYLKNKLPIIASFNVIQGFINITLSDACWLNELNNIYLNEQYGTQPAKNKKIVLEYCGPNTNKALHLGHVRNLLLGHSIANILQADGYEVHKVNIYNDRGLHICKSMVTWKKFGNGATPQSTNTKGDHFVTHYYVMFDKVYKQQIIELINNGTPEKIAEKQAPIMLEAQETLLKWEANDPDTLALWQKMNNWVYNGFNQTYKSLEVTFERDYKESETYLLGKQLVYEGLDKNVFYKETDNSIWVDLSEQGLDKKVLLRGDGTSIYLTQDLGVAELRYEHYHMDESIYVVGNEQEYHFKALKETLKKLNRPFANGIYHLSYGMVTLPEGKMKSREGTVVEADDLIENMISNAQEITEQTGKLDGLSPEEASELFRIVGLGALKFFILRVHPEKNILFNPKESIDLHGFTAPYVQYIYVRIQSLLRKQAIINPQLANQTNTLHPTECAIIKQLYKYNSAISEAASMHDPSVVVSFVYQLAKIFSKFYDELPILSAETIHQQAFRLQLSKVVGRTIKNALYLLGINVPNKM